VRLAIGVDDIQYKLVKHIVIVIVLFGLLWRLAVEAYIAS